MYMICSEEMYIYHIQKKVTSCSWFRFLDALVYVSNSFFFLGWPQQSAAVHMMDDNCGIIR